MHKAMDGCATTSRYNTCVMNYDSNNSKGSRRVPVTSGRPDDSASVFVIRPRVTTHHGGQRSVSRPHLKRPVNLASFFSRTIQSCWAWVNVLLTQVRRGKWSSYKDRLLATTYQEQHIHVSQTVVIIVVTMD